MMLSMEMCLESIGRVRGPICGLSNDMLHCGASPPAESQQSRDPASRSPDPIQLDPKWNFCPVRFHGARKAGSLFNAGMASTIHVPTLAE